MVEITTTGASSAFCSFVNEGIWQGMRVWVESPFNNLCASLAHDLQPMHHIGNPDGKDYGETGFLICDECGGIANQPTAAPC